MIVCGLDNYIPEAKEGQRPTTAFTKMYLKLQGLKRDGEHPRCLDRDNRRCRLSSHLLRTGRSHRICAPAFKLEKESSKSVHSAESSEDTALIVYLVNLHFWNICELL
ncbi:unnamed protein product, partial [Iphiclides podalirius]